MREHTYCVEGHLQESSSFRMKTFYTRLDGAEEFRYHWHDWRKEPKIIPQRYQAGGEVMESDAISNAGADDMIFVEDV